MALISCPECSGSCSDAAKACPHCGFPIQEEVEAKEQFLSTMKSLAFCAAKFRDDGYERSIMDAAIRSLEGETQRKIATLVMDFIYNNPDSDQQKCVLQVPKIMHEVLSDVDDTDDDFVDDDFVDDDFVDDDFVDDDFDDDGDDDDNFDADDASAVMMQIADLTVEARDSGVARSKLLEMQSAIYGDGLYSLASTIADIVYRNPAWNKTMCLHIISQIRDEWDSRGE